MCRALDTFRYFTLWKTFLQGIGYEVVLSGPTNRNTIETGSRIAPAELCLPTKVFLGHVIELAKKVDVLCIPRIVCRRTAKDLFFGCPKSLALPDMTRALIPTLPSTVELIIDERKSSEAGSFHRLAQDLGVNSGIWRDALQNARIANKEFLPENLSDYSFRSRKESIQETDSENSLLIGVVGHPYLLYDRELSLDLLDKLCKAGAKAIVPDGKGNSLVQKVPKELLTNWIFETELIEGAMGLVEQKQIKGLLLASSFACGTSAVTNEVIRRLVKQRRPSMPVLTILLDEHTAEAGLMTRLESFVDLIRLRTKQ